MIQCAAILAVLKWKGILDLGWGWLAGASVLSAVIPFSSTILFVVFQLMGLFVNPLSWWWILDPIFIDLGALAQNLNGD